MDDKQLLELAAKAAAIEHGADRLDRGLSLTEEDGRHRSLPRWNPIEDDGDALRLVVTLGMEVYVDTYPEGCACTEARSPTYLNGLNDNRTIVNHDSDPLTATRRAIVLCAAEIGKGMP